MTQKECPICRNPFTPPKSARYCSLPCKAEGARRNAELWRMANRERYLEIQKKASKKYRAQTKKEQDNGA